MTELPSRWIRNIRAQVGGAGGTHIPMCAWSTAASPSRIARSNSTLPPQPGSATGTGGSLVDGRLGVGVRAGLELERAVLDVEVVAEAGAQRVQDPAAVPVGQRLVGDHDVRRQHR